MSPRHGETQLDGQNVIWLRLLDMIGLIYLTFVIT
jgi:hypothetical protein